MNVSAQQWYCCFSSWTEEQAYAWREIIKGSPHGAGICALGTTMHPSHHSAYVKHISGCKFMWGCPSNKKVAYCLMLYEQLELCGVERDVAPCEWQDGGNAEENLFFKLLPPFRVRTEIRG
jgi:hypothetical protein